ncbi:MAG TPA: thermonuclease family protein [Solirubrobacter sp.]|nr:thermonuclease family protein [Solirubrobacter sp.]
MKRWLAIAALAVAGCAPADVADRDCTDFADQAEAQEWLDAHPGDPAGLDSDGNGVACESLGVAAVAAPKAERRARVLSVVDGDTIKVRLADGARETVRLVGIDTPETHRPNTPVECGARQAGAALNRLLARRDVLLVRDPTQAAHDRFGRTLAYVDVGARDAGEQLVRAGWAKPYVYDVPFERLAAYRRAASAARERAAGVHRACGGDFHRPAG